MSDDIVTRLRKQMSNEFVIDHPNMVRVPTLYDQAADELERLRKMLDAVLERENKDIARQLDIVRKVEVDRDMWRRALLHGVANLDNLCKGCEICEFIKRKHEEVTGMRGATFDSPK